VGWTTIGHVRCCTLVAKVGTIEVRIRLFIIVNMVTKVRLGLFKKLECFPWFPSIGYGNTYGYYGYHFYVGYDGKDRDNCLASEYIWRG
jgi:hypothetical protein